MPDIYLTTVEASAETPYSATTWWRVCRHNPGFALRVRGHYRIPREYVDRVKRGESPRDIVRSRNSQG